jgi:hypothetical protein
LSICTQFNEQEVELLISGTPDIDVDEWRAATEYHNYTGSDTAIVWWWRALKSFNREERAKVLSFATGTSRVPLSGFGDLQGVQGVQKFSIHRAFGASDRLPQAHTCKFPFEIRLRSGINAYEIWDRLQPDRSPRVHNVREVAPAAPVCDQRGWRGLRVCMILDLAQAAGHRFCLGTRRITPMSFIMFKPQAYLIVNIIVSYYIDMYYLILCTYSNQSFLQLILFIVDPVRDHKSGKLYGSPRSLTSIISVDTMSIQQYPPEIIEKIISIAADPILADHMSTLSMLALTCHAFRLLAQRCQYRHLQVGSRKRLDNLSQILTQNRHRYLHLHVKVLHLDDHILDLDDVGRSEDMLALGMGLRFSHPESFVNVRELSLFRMQMVGLDERDLTEFARSFPAATIVRIWLVRFTTTENMIAFLVSFPRLEELFIDSQ